MNSHLTTTKQASIRISLFPQSETHTVSRRHPFFWWYKKHIRSIRVEPVTKDAVFVAQYVDIRTGIIFINKKTAEDYLGYSIPDPLYVDQLYVEKHRDIFTYHFCTHCGHVESLKTEAVFLGPFNVVTHAISIRTELPCTNCNKTIPVDVSTESSDNQTSSDCAWI